MQIFLFALMVLMGLDSVAHAASDCPVSASLAMERASVTSHDGMAQFKLEIADSTHKRATGLMCRRELAPDHGMLFVYPHPQVVKMWMKNTLIPLDMLFVAADGRIVKIVENLKPRQEKRIDSGVPVTAVLELPAGTAARHRIQVDDRLSRQPREN